MLLFLYAFFVCSGIDRCLFFQFAQIQPQDETRQRQLEQKDGRSAHPSILKVAVIVIFFVNNSK